MSGGHSHEEKKEDRQRIEELNRSTHSSNDGGFVLVKVACLGETDEDWPSQRAVTGAE